MALIATPGVVDANSYLTVEEADDILTNRRLHTSAWTNTTSTAKRETALIWATRLLSQAFDWTGYVYDLNQSLPWPRTSMQDPDGRWLPYNEIPERLKEATADLALELLSRDRVATPEILGQGFSSARVGPLSVTVDPKQVLPLIPDYILNSLMLWGEPINPNGGMRTVPLRRV